jgi:hypothetical protein
MVLEQPIQIEVEKIIKKQYHIEIKIHSYVSKDIRERGLNFYTNIHQENIIIDTEEILGIDVFEWAYGFLKTTECFKDAEDV